MWRKFFYVCELNIFLASEPALGDKTISFTRREK